jgi:succinate dehydrogenase / fumarate reductase iron-sulfur subunit
MTGRRRRAVADEPVEPTPARAVEPAAEPVEPTPARPVEPAAEPIAYPGPFARLRIARRKQGRPGVRFEEFTVHVDPDTTVLDALLEVKRRDPSLVVRHSCMHGSCGTCGVRVNGREALACDTKIQSPASRKSPGEITVEPIANQRPVADLATDMVDFYARLEPVGMPAVRTAEGASGRPPENLKAFTRFENCIECGLCLSACPVAGTSHEYIGPAALAAANRVLEEPRGMDLGPVLALAAEPDSVWRCRDAMECTAVCPAAVDPAMAAISLRRRVAADGLRRRLRIGRAGGREAAGGADAAGVTGEGGDAEDEAASGQVG